MEIGNELVDRFDGKTRKWYDEHNLPFDRYIEVRDEEGIIQYRIKEVNDGHERDSWYRGHKVFGAYAVFKRLQNGSECQITPWYVMFGTAERNMVKLAYKNTSRLTLLKKTRMREVIETPCRVEWL